MKSARVMMLSAALVLMIVSAWATAGIEGSKHDFSNREWSGGDLCSACHTPHSEKPPKAAPLWEPKADLTRTFGTRAAGTGKPGPGSGTLVCLRCHDGTIARDTIAGVKTDRFVNKLSPGLIRAGHGRSDHPVGVKYPQFDKKFRPMTSVVGKGTVVLPDGKVECLSCHDPHNTTGAKPMLVTTNARSALCLTCHKK